MIKFLNMKPDSYNTLCAAVGAWVLTDTWAHFFGVLCLAESVIVSIEQCWPKERVR